MSSWQPVVIGDLGRVITGKTPSSAKPEQFGVNYPFVTPSDIQFGNKYVKTDRFLSEQGIEAHRRIKLPEKAVCVVCIGATIGKVCVTNQTSVSNQQINSIIVDAKKHDPDFVFYIASVLRATLEAYAGGAATPIVNKGAFSKIKLLVPDLITQRKIAAILTAYDDLIEINKRRIVLLEKMAEEIYREWFVRMRFPGHQDTRFIKDVPEGWEKKKFGHFCMLKRGYDLPNALVVQGPYPVLASTSIKTYHNHYKVEPPVITTGRSGSLGDVLISFSRAWPLNTSLYVRNFFGNSPFFIFYTLKKMGLEKFNSGAGVPTLNRNHLNAIPMSVPNKELQKRFGTVIEPIHRQIEVYRSLNNNLTKTRDFLLPRLVSGKLSVDDLDIQFPPGMQVSSSGVDVELEASHA